MRPSFGVHIRPHSLLALAKNLCRAGREQSKGAACWLLEKPGRTQQEGTFLGSPLPPAVRVEGDAHEEQDE